MTGLPTRGGPRSQPEHWPSSPGLYLPRSTSPADQQDYDGFARSRPASLDLTASYDTYDMWTELKDLPPLHQDDTETLLKSSARASICSTSSASSDAQRSRGCLGQTKHLIVSFWRLPVIKHILWPLQQPKRYFNRLKSNSRFHGWRMGILLGSFMSSVVLGCNITILVLGAIRNGGYQDGLAVPMTGDAGDMSWWSSAFHIMINALSTLLLAASNYTMQVLSSPTRGEIDRAHSANQWLNIGVLSTRNLGRISRRRTFLFMVMALSSIPVHLFYNSAVFYIGATNEYNIFLIENASTQHIRIQDQSDAANASSKGDASYQLLTSRDLVTAYDTDFVNYGDVYIPIDAFASKINRTSQDGFLDDWPNVDERIMMEDVNATWPIEMVSVKFSTLRDIDANSRNWIDYSLAYNKSLGADYNIYQRSPRFAHFTHGYAKKTKRNPSRIQLSLTFMIIVISCNFVKLCTMLWVLFMEKLDYIVTMGDGAASFLEHPDTTTEQMCVATRHDIMAKAGSSSQIPKQGDDELASVIRGTGSTWTKQYSKYSTALDRDREIGSVFVLTVIGMLSIGALIVVCTLGTKLSTRWGSASGNAFRQTDGSTQATLFNAWLANAAQLVLSFCYLAINSECSAMAGAEEWNNLGTSRKGLRVTRPRGEQRDTYFLQLPYRWSLPLTAASGGLHWLLSQSLFIVRIDEYDRNGVLNPFNSKAACGFSGTSFLALVSSFYLLISIVGLVGRRTFRVRIPFAASCSLVISAACHPSVDDRDPQLRPVQWGVVEERMFDGEKHCALSSKPVLRPKVGEKYL